MKVVLTSLSLAISLSFAGYAFAASPRSEPVSPILPAQEIHIGKAELGKKLYFDPRLSKSGFISCNSCHNLSMGGSDNLKRPSVITGNKVQSTHRLCSIPV